MLALLVEQLSEDLSGLSLHTLPSPTRNAGEVLVRVHAASLNYPDLLMTKGKYQFKPEPPFVSGMELAGEVLEADLGSAFAVGDRVRGGAKTGAFAEIASVPEASLHRIPDGVDFATAAAMGSAYHTAYVALVECGQLQPGQTVLVHGASGGVGLAACDLGKALGANIIAATHKHEKLEAIHALVEPKAVILNRDRFREEVAAITDGRLCDLVYDPIGGDVFDESTRCVTFGGRLLVVGFVSGRIAEVATNIPLIKGFSIVGVRAGEYARRFPDRGQRIAAEIDRLLTDGVIRPHIDRVLPLSQWRNGFEAMARGEVIGKLVFEPSR
ncbi:MAG: NADPH:quinone oxidoreductase family protein [Sphingomonadaceae bacterium]